MTFNFNHKSISPIANWDETIFNFDCKNIFGSSSSSNEPSYTKLEYIESSATQYIDTGMQAYNGITVECDAECVKKDSTYSILFGAKHDSSTGFYVGRANSVSGFCALITTYVQDSFTKWNLGTKYNIKFVTDTSGFTLYNNNQLVVTQQQTVHDDKNHKMWLFGLNNMGSLGYGGSFKVYNFKVTNTETGALLQHLIPVRRSDNVVCMYDLVSNKFFTNSGTGEFIGSDTN